VHQPGCHFAYPAVCLRRRHAFLLALRPPSRNVAAAAWRKIHHWNPSVITCREQFAALFYVKRSLYFRLTPAGKRAFHYRFSGFVGTGQRCDFISLRYVLLRESKLLLFFGNTHKTGIALRNGFMSSSISV
jgi:hypothetical protein